MLQHSGTCRKIGETQVKAKVINRFDDGAKPFGHGAGHSFSSESFGDDNGNETIDVFECTDDCPVRLLDKQSGEIDTTFNEKPSAALDGNTWGGTFQPNRGPRGYTDTGGASRFYYTSKSSMSERNERTLPAGLKNTHPTVKSLDLMRWLCKLVTQPGGHILDPFAGSGSTLVAAIMEGMNATGIEITDEYIPIIKARINGVQIGGLF